MAEKKRELWTAPCRKCGNPVRVHSENTRAIEDGHFTMRYEHIHCPGGRR